MSPEQSRIVEGKISLPYRWAMGPTITRFFEGFQEKRILGTRCDACGRVLVPARAFCSRCFKDMDEWVQVKDEGVLRTWVLINFPYEGQPLEPPYIIGVIELDGSDNGFPHFVGGFPQYDIEFLKDRVTIGMRVKAVWKEGRDGNILDIAYFRPVA